MTDIRTGVTVFVVTDPAEVVPQDHIKARPALLPTEGVAEYLVAQKEWVLVPVEHLRVGDRIQKSAVGPMFDHDVRYAGLDGVRVLTPLNPRHIGGPVTAITERKTVGPHSEPAVACLLWVA